MGRLLDDRCLVNFMAIYEHGSLSHAAETALLTQPALSKSLARLESDLNVMLFVRRNRGLFPTEAAHELYECAKRIETETRRSLVKIASYDSSLKGRIRIGAGQMWTWLRIPEVIRQFMPKFPNLEIDLVSAPMQTLVEQLEAGTLDIVVGDMADVQVPNGCNEHKFSLGDQMPFARTEHPLVSHVSVTLADLVGFPWIGFTNDNVFTRNVKSICAAAGVPMPTVPLRASSLAAILAVVSGGDYVVVLPEDFSEVADRFGIRQVGPDLKMWNLATSALFFAGGHNQGPIDSLVALMAEAVSRSNVRQQPTIGYHSKAQVNRTGTVGGSNSQVG